jgi:tetratricopeptide (TPR) repeat protein
LFFFPNALKIAVSAFLLCLLVAAAGIAGGRSERLTRERLAEAEALVEQRQLSEAILLLTRIVKEDSEAFDAAEKLMQRIRALRGEYNEKYQELLVALFEENDVERALELIQELQALDPTLTASTLGDVREDVEIAAALIRFREIMDEARELLRQKRYREAVDRYMEGFALGGESLENTDGDIAVTAIAGGLGRLRSSVGAFFEASRTLEGTIAGLPAGLPTMTGDEQMRAAGEVRTILRSLASDRAVVERGGELFRRQGEQVRTQNAELAEADRRRKLELFLSIASRLVFGRENEPPEGISTALAAVWEGGYEDAGGAFTGPGDAVLSEGVALYEGGRFTEARAVLAGAEAPLRLALDIQTLWPLAVEPGSALPLDDDSLAAAQGYLPEFLMTEVKIREARDTDSLISIVAGLPELEARKVGSAPEIEAAVRELRPLGTALDDLADPWREELQRRRALEREGVALSGVVERTSTRPGNGLQRSRPATWGPWRCAGEATWSVATRLR